MNKRLINDYGKTWASTNKELEFRVMRLEEL